jgi:hypothetical protein
VSCFRFVSFRFSGKCRRCGKCAEWHVFGDTEFLCGDCCPGCKPAQPFDDEPLPGDVTGEQNSLF